MGTRPGDKVRVLCGGGPVFVLRPLPDGHSFGVVGDGYAFECENLDETPSEFRGPDQKFVLV